MSYLVVASSICDGHAIRLGDVKAVSVGTAVVITVLAVDGDRAQCKSVGTVDGEDLVWRVKYADTGNFRIGQVMGLEELGLGDTIIALSVPPQSTLAVKLMTVGTLNGDGGSGHGEERTFPLIVVPSGGSLENDHGAIREVSKVQSCAGGDRQSREGDGGTVGLGGGGGSCSIGTAEDARLAR